MDGEINRWFSRSRSPGLWSLEQRRRLSLSTLPAAPPPHDSQVFLLKEMLLSNCLLNIFNVPKHCELNMPKK